MNIVLFLIVIAVIAGVVYFFTRKPTNVAVIAKHQSALDRASNGITEAVHSEVESIEGTINAARAKIVNLLGTGAVHPVTAAKLNTTNSHIVSALNA